MKIVYYNERRPIVHEKVIIQNFELHLYICIVMIKNHLCLIINIPVIY